MHKWSIIIVSWTGTKQNSKQKYYRFYLEQKWMAWKNHNDFEKSNKTRFDVQ